MRPGLNDTIFTPLTFALTGSTTATVVSHLAGDSFGALVLSNAITYSGLALGLAALVVMVRAGGWKKCRVNARAPQEANDPHAPDTIKAVSLLLKSHTRTILGNTSKTSFYVVLAWGFILATWLLVAVFSPDVTRLSVLVAPALILPGLVALVWIWALNCRPAFHGASHGEIESLRTIEMAANELGVTLAEPSAEHVLRRPGGHAAIIWKTRALSEAVIQASNQLMNLRVQNSDPTGMDPKKINAENNCM